MCLVHTLGVCGTLWFGCFREFLEHHIPPYARAPAGIEDLGVRVSRCLRLVAELNLG
jgi:hypothetical protein